MPSPTLITETEAIAILGNTKPWVSTSSVIRVDALGWAEVYFLSVYSCPTQNFDDAASISASIKEGLSMLANEHLTKSLFERQTGKAAITEESKEVSGAVKKSVKYAQSTGGKWVDYFTNVTALVGQVCSIEKGKSTGTSSIVRI